MKIALDVCVPRVLIKQAQKRGFEVVYVAGEAVQDGEWLPEAVKAGADVIVAKDIDVEAFAAEQDLLYVCCPHKIGGDKLVKLIFKRLDALQARIEPNRELRRLNLLSRRIDEQHDSLQQRLGDMLHRIQNETNRIDEMLKRMKRFGRHK